ncbi:MAG: glycosyltransferase [bacterium]
MKNQKFPCILYVSTFPPRECGIATFTQDLTNAIDKEFNPAVKSKILAMNANGTSIYNYPRKVNFQINDIDLNDYLRVAKEINKSSEIKLVNVQHEYGLFGGEWGNYLLPFLEMIKKPKIITFHTVLSRPRPGLKKITQDIVSKADGIVVMTRNCEHLLRRAYQTPRSKPIFVIPHGVHHVPFPSKSRAKRKLNLSGHTILSTFGMINSDKGIEYAIEALPEIVAKYPKVLYLVIGATHSLVAKHEGEKYRNKLIRLVKKLKLEDNVKFYNKYLELNELIDFLKATDIYISPTLNPKQAVSGTISYALSCACPVISTKNQYGKDTINRERGILVDFANSEQIKKAAMMMLEDKEMTKNMKKACYYYSRHMTWQNVALAYFEGFNKFAKIMPRQKDKLPSININHVKALTDEFGMIQFAVHTKPDQHSGYCLDDNSRALIGCVEHYENYPSQGTLNLIKTYFNYIKTSQKRNGHFHDFINYSRNPNNDNPESEDSFGRAIWSLGIMINSEKLPTEMIANAYRVFNKAKPVIEELKFSRAIAFSLIGLCYIHDYYSRMKNEKKLPEINELIKQLADKLLSKYDEQLKKANKKGDKWLWFDNHLTYSNYKIPESLLRAYKIIKDKKYLIAAKETINFLSSITFDKEYYNAIGQDGWYFRDGKRAYFDQQPEDASSAVQALIVAWEVSKRKSYADQAKLAFAWFLGKNHLHQMIYDEATGGCYDGLGKNSINFNQGAESTISYFLARLAIAKVYK